LGAVRLQYTVTLVFQQHHLRFLKPATTSAGAYETRALWLAEWKPEPNKTFLAECAPLQHLSIDEPEALQKAMALLSREPHRMMDKELTRSEDLNRLPALQFALECLQRQQATGIPGILYNNGFTRGERTIPINGLVWMADRDTMLQSAIEKAEAGYRCIKFKVGALDFDAECRLLEAVRKRYNAFRLEIRVDANGAFGPDDALEKMRDLKRFELHSIEQPIKPGQWELMGELSARAALPIALDEELIGINPQQNALRLLKTCRPAYLVFKPTLLGGFTVAEQWISQLGSDQKGWWATSALESNIGLSAIAQWCGNDTQPIHQGLGTGRLFEENFPSQLSLEGEFMRWVLP
jgi:O-succinylbenzoate synthase